MQKNSLSWQLVICCCTLGLIASGCTLDSKTRNLLPAKLDTSDAQPGEFILYPHPAGDGITARRKFRDSRGNCVKTIVYGRSMIPAAIYLSTYDQGNQLVKSVWLRGDGTRKLERRFSQNKETLGIHYDDTGKRVIGIRGQTAQAQDVNFKWGKACGNIRCGAGVTSLTAPYSSRGVYFSIWNIGSAPVGIDALDFELRDLSGRVLPNNRQAVLFGRIQPGQSYCDSQSLGTWFERLPVGDYVLRVRVLEEGQQVPAVSRPIFLPHIGKSP